MLDSEEYIPKFLEPDKTIVFCKGPIIKHHVYPVILFLRPSKCVRRGICRACGQVYVSMILRPYLEEKDNDV